MQPVVTRKKRGARQQPRFLSYAVMLYRHSATRFSHHKSICLTMFAGYMGRETDKFMCFDSCVGVLLVRCVLVLATFPTKGPTNVNAERRQQLKVFGRTPVPRTCPSSVLISRCSVRLCFMGRLQCELATSQGERQIMGGLSLDSGRVHHVEVWVLFRYQG